MCSVEERVLMLASVYPAALGPDSSPLAARVTSEIRAAIRRNRVRMSALRRLIPLMSPTPDHERLFKEWLGEHRGILVKVARSFAGSAADSADLEQELMLQVWTSLPSYRRQAKPSTWLYRVCLNTALTWHRGTERRERLLEPMADHGSLAANGSSPAESAGDRELVDKLYAAIQGIPEFDRALVLLMLDGLAYREIAEVTGLTENHVGVALTRARKRLALKLKGVADELE
jgi:RNA polymerase sigma-70 factor, ECF subfamily